MKNFEAICNHLYDVIILLSLILCGIRYRKLDKGARLIAIWVALGYISEFIAEIYARKFHTNTLVYSIYSLLELGVIGLYFSGTVAGLKKRHFVLRLTAISILAGVLYLIFIQPPDKLNSNFMFLECIIISGLSLYAIFKMQNAPSVAIWREVHFWIPAILLFYECTAFWSWGVYNYVLNNIPNKTIYFSIALLLINIITYAGISAVLIFYPKMKHSHV